MVTNWLVTNDLCFSLLGTVRVIVKTVANALCFSLLGKCRCDGYKLVDCQRFVF